MIEDLRGDNYPPNYLALMMNISKGTKLYSFFNEYTIDKQIGQGGSGRVYKAYDSRDNVVAIKLIIKSEVDSEKLHRFKNEMQFCFNNNHPNIINILDWGTDEDDVLFYVMKLADSTLRDRLKEGIDGADAVEIFISLLSGLEFAHDLGVFHRDLKPENILFFGKNNNAVIADFGIAHFDKCQQFTIVETKVGSRLANFQYAAPEQRQKGKMVDARADIYSCALILNEMFTRQLVSGSGYKKIGEVDDKYSFLDNVFESMYQQEPANRLYPAKKILMIVQAELEKISLTKQEERIANELRHNEEALCDIKLVQNPNVRDISVKSNQLEVYFDERLPERWFQILKSGYYSHTNMLGYGPEQTFGGDDVLCMPLHGYEKDYDLKNTIKNMVEWAEITTTICNNELKKNARKQYEAEKERIERELAERKRNKELRDWLKDEFT